MSKSNTPAAPKKKGSAGKTFLSVIFYILIQACSIVLALCMELRTKSGSVLSAIDSAIGFNVMEFVTGEICFWCAFSAVILWFGLWFTTTGRIASAIRGLGTACAISAGSVLLGDIITLLMVCVFGLENALSPFADSLPSLFTDGCGDNVIFLLSSIMIASVGGFVCAIKKLPKKISKKSHNAEPAPAPAAEPTPEPVHTSAPAPQDMPYTANTGITNIDVNVSGNSAAQTDNESLIRSLAGLCHICGKKNEAGVSFCGGCGAKLI